MTHTRSIELIATDLDGSSHSFRLAPTDGVFIGKSGNCGLRLSHKEISDIHCRIGFEAGELWAQDWMSTSGTLLNGQPLTAKTQLSTDALLELGPFTIEIKELRMAETFEPECNPERDSAKPKAVACSIAHFSHIASDEDQDSPDCQDHEMGAYSDIDHQGDPESSSADDDIVANSEYEIAISHEPAEHSSQHSDALPNESQEASLHDQFSADPADEAEWTAKAEDSYSESMDELEADAGSKVSFDAGLDIFDDDDPCENAVECDSETIALLQAEIEDLRAALAHQDVGLSDIGDTTSPSDETEDSHQVLHRLQELSEEANRAEERVLLLEEMLQAAEEANRAEAEERTHLEAWVGDIERRIGQREQEHAAEMAALKTRLSAANHRQRHLQQQLENAASNVGDSKESFQSELESLQRENQHCKHPSTMLVRNCSS